MEPTGNAAFDSWAPLWAGDFGTKSEIHWTLENVGLSSSPRSLYRMPPKNPKLEKAKREKAKKDAAAKEEADAAAAAALKLTPLGALNEDDNDAEDQLRNQGIIVTYSESARKTHANTRDILVENITMTYHGSPLIEESDLSLNYGNRYGFIGRNGCGKSTFMNVIGSRAIPIPEGIDMFHVKEEIEPSNMTALEAVMSVDMERARLEAEAEVLNDIVAENPDDEEALERINTVYERLEALDASTAETRASKILAGLGFSPWKQGQPTNSFSGGWRMRVSLARALFIAPTLLLLDEPTNHLDMEAVVWLEDYLSKWDKILFMVSHSQDFMNAVCTNMVHFQAKKLNYFGGNYDTYINTLKEQNEEQEKRYKAEQESIQHMKDYVAKFGQGNAKMAKQAQSKEKTMMKMVRGGLTDKVIKEKGLDFRFNDCGTLTPPVLQCTDLAFGYPGHEILYSGVDFGLDLDSRVALVGPNGAGKSTLLKALTGELTPVAGSVRPHSHLRISKFTQHFIDVLDLDMCPLDYMMKLWPEMSKEDGRKFLGRYGVSGQVQTQIMGQLSDGQKSRVVLAKMAKENPHMLFLDEPTNHLDIESIDSLAKAINEFPGGMMLVSHDMRLISQVAKEIWMVDNKTVQKFVGEISDFKMHLKAQLSKAGMIEGGGKIVAPEVKFVPLAPLKTFSDKITLKTAPTQGKGPSVAATSTEEMDPVKRARMELAELAIKRQRARQAAASAGNDFVEENDDKDDGEMSEKKAMKEAKKMAKLAETNAAKEANAIWQAEQDVIIEKRRIEKEAEIAEAHKVAEQARKDFEIWQAAKAEKDRVQAEKDAQEAARVAKILAEKRREKEERRAKREALRKEQERKAAEAAEAKARADPWTQEQQDLFEKALLTFTVAIEKDTRWTEISKAVGEEKSRNQCIGRYKFLKDLVRQQQAIANAE